MKTNENKDEFMKSIVNFVKHFVIYIYMMLSVENRNNHNVSTMDELFFLYFDELQDV